MTDHDHDALVSLVLDTFPGSRVVVTRSPIAPRNPSAPDSDPLLDWLAQDRHIDSAPEPKGPTHAPSTPSTGPGPDTLSDPHTAAGTARRRHPMKRTDAFPSRYLKAADLDRPRVYTIEAVEQATVNNDDGEKRVVVMSFTGEEKQLIVNATNWQTCEDLFGEDSDDWLGQPIEIYATTTLFRGKKTPALRLRPPRKATKAAVPPVSEDADDPVDVDFED